MFEESLTPDGLIVRVVTKSAGGLGHVEVWESKESWESFRDDRIRPAVASVLAKIGMSEPPEHSLDVDRKS